MLSGGSGAQRRYPAGVMHRASVDVYLGSCAVKLGLVVGLGRSRTLSWIAGIAEGRVHPMDARVLFAGDHFVWEPGGGYAGEELWTHLCLLVCRAVRHLRCCRAAHGQAFPAAAVLALSASWDGACHEAGLAARGC
jgi:hypothetical protein